MKLLIVDDEKLTRDGLLTTIDWEELDISPVLQADDGLNGLRIAIQEKPDIVLCDVRMPRMDGVKLVEQLGELLPNASVIFMSGYSDKEYLKAAIKLKAVNYVEKPLNPREIREAVLEAKERVEQRRRDQKREQYHSMETASALALALTRPYREQKESISTLLEELSLHFAPGTYFTTYLVKCRDTLQRELDMECPWTELDSFLKRIHLGLLYFFKQNRYHVFHIYGPGEPSKVALESVGKQLAALYRPLGDFYIARGEAVSGLSRVNLSYSSGVALMQSCFFFDCGQVLYPTPREDNLVENLRPPLPSQPDVLFRNALAERNQASCLRLLEQIYAFCCRRHDLLTHWVKDLYYKLFMALQENCRTLRIPHESMEAMPESILEYMEECFAFEELHGTLTAGTEAFFSALQSHISESSTIFLIKEYISKHYSNESLSVRKISEQVFLSATYVCTYFKNETGQTLNQYLTDYRIEKAKQLLCDPRYQIADISDKVGYSNGNYFGKSFKKLVGLSPSEYREKMLQ